MHSQFLVRPAPLDGESLSSWRQRSGWANGYRLYPLPDQRIRRADPDLGLNPQDIAWLAETHVCPHSSVRAMSLRGVSANVMGEQLDWGRLTWWISARYGKVRSVHGAMYCPMCLAEDEIPYFRLAWRFGFVYACIKHGVTLHDSCPQCGSAPWPAGCGVPAHTHPSFLSLHRCWSCGERLTEVAMTEMQQVLEPVAWYAGERMQFGSISATSAEAFAALRAICQLFLRGASRHQIIEANNEWSVIAKKVDQQQLSNSIELLEVGVRALLVPTAMELLREWPERFVSFAQDANVSRMHFSGIYHQLPAWFNAILRDRLARQVRWVDAGDIRLAADQLRQAGIPPTKAAVRRHLGWQGDIDARLLREEEPSRSRSRH